MSLFFFFEGGGWCFMALFILCLLLHSVAFIMCSSFSFASLDYWVRI
jgi:hypothetical protein